MFHLYLIKQSLLYKDDVMGELSRFYRIPNISKDYKDCIEMLFV